MSEYGRKTKQIAGPHFSAPILLDEFGGMVKCSTVRMLVFQGSVSARKEWAFALYGKLRSFVSAWIVGMFEQGEDEDGKTVFLPLPDNTPPENAEYIMYACQGRDADLEVLTNWELRGERLVVGGNQYQQTSRKGYVPVRHRKRAKRAEWKPIQ